VVDEFNTDCNIVASFAAPEPDWQRMSTAICAISHRHLGNVRLVFQKPWHQSPWQAPQEDRPPIFDHPNRSAPAGEFSGWMQHRRHRHRTRSTPHDHDRAVVGGMRALGNTPWTACAPFGEGEK